MRRAYENAVEGSRSIHDLRTPIRLFFLSTTIYCALDNELGEPLTCFCLFSVMIFPNHTLPHSESIVWTSVNQISALSESLSPFLFFTHLVQPAHRHPLRAWIPSRFSCRVAYGECRHVFCSLMRIPDGRTRMSPAHTKVPHRTARNGSGDLLKRIAYLILLSSQNRLESLLIDFFSRWPTGL